VIEDDRYDIMTEQELDRRLQEAAISGLPVI